ncbi:MAG: hypothetical protein RR308_01040 [Hafnia sp.]
MNKQLRNLEARAREKVGETLLLACRVNSGRHIQTNTCRDEAGNVICVDSRFTLDTTGVELTISDFTTVCNTLRDSSNDASNKIAESLLSDGWKPHSIGPGLTYRFSKRVSGELQYREITTVIERKDNTLTAVVRLNQISSIELQGDDRG